MKRRSLALVVALGMFGVVAVANTGSVGAATSGSISGRVVSAADGQPIEGVCVSLDAGPQTTTASDGTYAIDAIDPGGYTVQYRDCTPSPRFVSQWYLGADSASSATKVTVSDGSDTPLADVSLTEGVVVSGTVNGDGAPLAGASVEVNATSTGFSTGTSTDADGHYVTEPVPVGSYRVRFSGGSAPGQWAPQYWNDKPSSGTADTLVLDGADIPSRAGVDATLTVAARVSGTVTDANGSPLEGICVDASIVHDGTQEWINGATTGSDGTYSMDSLPTAPLIVHFRDCASGDHLEQWFQGATGPDTATTIALSPGEDRPGIDAQLVDGIAIAGRVTDTGGAPIAGINVFVNNVSSGPGGYAQTDGDGNYRTDGLPEGDYRVQFSASGPNPAWANQFWNDRPSWNSADILHLGAADGPTRTGIDAALTAAATISGVVRDQSANPVGNVCVSAIVDTVTGPDWVAGTSSAPDGTYTLTGLPEATTRVQFDDCNHTGPYLQQWWDQQPTYDTATTLAVTPGSATTGIDASLVRAGAISGHVTDREGNPLSGICAQASSDTAFGGLGRTDGSGNYTILLATAGSFRVQFVDCNDTTKYRAQWWDDQPTAATAAPVNVGAGGIVDDVDAHLDLGGPATISGNVTTLRGATPDSGCVVAYLPNQFAKFVPVAADGSYTITDVPSGTFALAALSCADGGEPNPVVPDPAVAGVAYRGLWWDDVPLVFDQGSDGGPDPIAQHANLVTVNPGDALTGYDFCFGCDAIKLQAVNPEGTSVVLAYTEPDLVSPAVQSQDVLPSIVYTATCTTTSGGGDRSASGSSQTLVVDDLTPGATYSCVVVGSVDGVAVVASPQSNGFTVPGAPAAAAATPSSGALAFTGRSLERLGELALALLLSGLALLVVQRRRRSRVA